MNATIDKAEYRGTKYLNLRSLNLVQLPARLIESCEARLANVQTLHLQNNSIKFLPDEFGFNFRHLRSLALNENGLTSLPRSFFFMDQLSFLDISGNDFSAQDFPAELCECKSLQILRISGCNIWTVPKSIGNLQNLKKLCLPNNYIAALPLEIYSLSGLERLNLASNLISCISSEIRFLKQLLYLNCKNNNISYIPPPFVWSQLKVRTFLTV